MSGLDLNPPLKAYYDDMKENLMMRSGSERVAFFPIVVPLWKLLGNSFNERFHLSLALALSSN